MARIANSEARLEKSAARLVIAWNFVSAILGSEVLGSVLRIGSALQAVLQQSNAVASMQMRTKG